MTSKSPENPMRCVPVSRVTLLLLARHPISPRVRAQKQLDTTKEKLDNEADLKFPRTAKRTHRFAITWFSGLGQVRSISRFASAIRIRTIARIRSISAVRRPCVVRAARIRSSPSAVRGPLDSPPCILHRPAGIAGASQGAPVLVRAPHLGEA
jgi:hypothetical protein